MQAAGGIYSSDIHWVLANNLFVFRLRVRTANIHRVVVNVEK